MVTKEINSPVHKDQVVHVERILGLIDGEEIEARLNLVAVNNRQPFSFSPEDKAYFKRTNRFKISRLALSNEDRMAREMIIEPFMQAAGMEVMRHPLGSIGIYKGADESLSPVLVLSHTDSVEDADKYDGASGVVGGIAAVGAIHQSGIRPQRSIIVAALTGEESARFGVALVGSMGLFHGLDESFLAAHKGKDQSIGDALGSDVDKVRLPFFGPKGKDLPTPYAAIELHPDQTGLLEKHGFDLGIVEKVAAPQRYKVRIRADPNLETNLAHYPHFQYLELRVDGKADHSGATRMGKENRLDGLVRTAELLVPLLEEQGAGDLKGRISVLSVNVADGAMNKVPGVTTTFLKIEGDSPEDLVKARDDVEAMLDYIDQHDTSKKPEFVVQETDKLDGVADSIKKSAQQEQHKTALKFVLGVNSSATARRDDEVVGTVGSYVVTDAGDIKLELDVRGIALAPRDALIEDVYGLAGELSSGACVDLGEILPGSGDEPVTLDADLVALAGAVIKKNQIASYETTFSAAGHDIQNVSRAGIPSVMIFFQSRDGIAHNPDAYTTPDNLEKGVRALAALVWELANAA